MTALDTPLHISRAKKKKRERRHQALIQSSQLVFIDIAGLSGFLLFPRVTYKQLCVYFILKKYLYRAVAYIFPILCLCLFTSLLLLRNEFSISGTNKKSLIMGQRLQMPNKVNIFFIHVVGLYKMEKAKKGSDKIHFVQFYQVLGT